MVADLMDLALSIAQHALSDWEREDVERYFELAYRDPDMQFYVRTNSSRAAEAVAQGFAQMLVQRMRVLRARDENRGQLPSWDRKLLP
jgi:hypothetical protein